MAEKIRISNNAIEALEKEVKLAMESPNRTLKNITNNEVLLLLKNPGKEIEIIDPSTKKVIGTIAAGLGGAGLAAAWSSGVVIAGGAAAAGGATATAATAAFSGATFAVGAKAAAVSAAVPGPGWLIAGAILVVTAVTAAGVAITSYDDKIKGEENFNQKQKLFQGAIKKLTEEIRQLKKEAKEYTERYEYLVSLLETLQAPAQ